MCCLEEFEFLEWYCDVGREVVFIVKILVVFFEWVRFLGRVTVRVFFFAGELFGEFFIFV